MSYFSNKNWKRVYKVTFNDADIFSHKVYRRGSDDNFILDTIELESDNSLIIFEEQIPVVQRFGNSIKTMTYIGKLLGHRRLDEEKET